MNVRGRGMRQDDVYYVLAVEVSLMAEEVLLSLVVIVGTVLEVPVPASHVEPGQLGSHGPAGERAGAFVDVFFGVVADAHREQL